MKLTERQKKHLRREAHAMKPLLSMGDKGITDTFLVELNSTLEHHELIKIRVRAGDREARDQAISEIAEKMGAMLINRVGNIATLYRQRKKDPRITLPPPG
jgi:RNA-binding protein